MKKLVILLMCFLVLASTSSAIWWNTTYSNKVQINNTGWNCSAAMCQFAIPTALNKTATNGTDIRVLDSTESTLLNFWRDDAWNYTNASGNLWVNASNNTAMIYVYYNATGAADTSSIDNTFLFGDDFNDGSLNTSKWALANSSGTLSEIGGKLTIGATASNGYMQLFSLNLSGVGFSSLVSITNMSKPPSTGGTNENQIQTGLVPYTAQNVFSNFSTQLRSYEGNRGLNNTPSYYTNQTSFATNGETWIISKPNATSICVNYNQTNAACIATNIVYRNQTKLQHFVNAGVSNATYDFIVTYPYQISTAAFTFGKQELAPNTTLSACQVLNTSNVSLTLDRNVYSTNSGCFNVTASNVSIDCAGYSITGNNSTNTYGIWSNSSNTVVKNCIISNYTTGIMLFTLAANGTLTNNTVIQTSTYYAGYDGAGISVWANDTVISGGSITSNVYGIYTGGDRDTITGVSIPYASSVGVWFVGSGGSLDCLGKSIAGSWGAFNIGVILFPSNNTVKNCVISNFSTQIRAGGNNHTIFNNTLSGSNAAHLELAGSAVANTVCLNNFTATSVNYVSDTNGGNFYNCTTGGKNQGNIWANVVNGSLAISGNATSAYAGLFTGNLGADYPYTNITSKGKFACNFASCADYAPLTPTWGGSITACTSGNVLFNFTFYNQSTPNPNTLSNVTMEATFQIRAIASPYIANFSFNFSTPNTWQAVCMDVSPIGFVFDSVQVYRSAGGRDVYYYLLNQTFASNTTVNISLYTLDSAGSKLTQYQVYSGSNLPVINAYLQIQRYYPATNQLITVAMAKTDTNGLAEAYAVPNDVTYRYIVSKNYAIIYTSNAAPLPCDPGATQCTTQILVNSGIVNEYTGFIGNSLVGCSVSADNTSVACTSNNPSGTGTGIELKVYQIQTYSNTLVCDNTIATGSGTVVCSGLNASNQYSYVATATVGSIMTIGSGYIGISVKGHFDKTYGMIAAICLIFIFAGLGMFGGFAASIVMMLVGLTISALIGFLDIPIVALLAIDFVGLTIAALLRG